MWLDLSPLRKYPAFRRLYLGQLVSVLGTSLSFVALPYHIYEKTHSTASVGLIGVVQLVPLVLTGFWGGALADSTNRVRMIIRCEIGLAILCALYPWATRGPAVWPCFVLAASLSALSGIHRPALESLTPRLVAPEDISRISALNGFRGTFAHVIGPTIGGLLLGQFGIQGAFWIDSASYLISVLFLVGVPEPSRMEKMIRPSWSTIVGGLRYALERPVLLGSYLVDIAAMMFCYPLALFPALAGEWAAAGGAGGNARVLGWLYSSGALGALICSTLSRWTVGKRRYGRFITVAALGWCVAIGAAGFSTSAYWALGFFIASGFADMVSAMFRSSLWNETIPDAVRGRLAGIEMLSYMSGPLIGNTWMGFLAASQGTHRALQIGAGVSFAVIVVIVAFLVPAFWKFRSELLPRGLEPPENTGILELNP
jgi:MFS family permease